MPPLMSNIWLIPKRCISYSSPSAPPTWYFVSLVYAERCLVLHWNTARSKPLEAFDLWRPRWACSLFDLLDALFWVCAILSHVWAWVVCDPDELLRLVRWHRIKRGGAKQMAARRMLDDLIVEHHHTSQATDLIAWWLRNVSRSSSQIWRRATCNIQWE